MPVTGIKKNQRIRLDFASMQARGIHFCRAWNRETTEKRTVRRPDDRGG
jgi:hypothetical protein